MFDIMGPTHGRRYGVVGVTIEPPDTPAIRGMAEVKDSEWYGPRGAEVIEEAKRDCLDKAMEFYRRDRAARGWGG